MLKEEINIGGEGFVIRVYQSLIDRIQWGNSPICGARVGISAFPLLSMTDLTVRNKNLLPVIDISLEINRWPRPARVGRTSDIHCRFTRPGRVYFRRQTANLRGR